MAWGLGSPVLEGSQAFLSWHSKISAFSVSYLLWKSPTQAGVACFAPHTQFLPLPSFSLHGPPILQDITQIRTLYETFSPLTSNFAPSGLQENLLWTLHSFHLRRKLVVTLSEGLLGVEGKGCLPVVYAVSPVSAASCTRGALPWCLFSGGRRFL